MLRTKVLTVTVAGLALTLGGLGTAVAAETAGGRHGTRTVQANLQDRDGASVGTVKVRTARGQTTVEIRARHLPPGWHGVHIHSVGTCEGDFSSAGSHLNPDGATHPGHAGDLPQLLVMKDGTARASFATDRFTARSLLDKDGSAFIVHSDPDNYAHVPGRYLDGGSPDQATLGTGDAGSRQACGAFTASRR